MWKLAPALNDKAAMAHITLDPAQNDKAGLEGHTSKSPLVIAVEEDIEFLRIQSEAFARGEMDKSVYEAMCLKTKDAILETVAKVPGVTRAEATAIIKLLSHSNFTFERKDIIAVTNQRVAVTTNSSSLAQTHLGQRGCHVKQSLQSLSDGQNYLTEDLWSMIPDFTKPLHMKLKAFVDHFLSLGASNLNELSLVNLVSLWLLYEAMCTRCATFDPQLGYARLQMFKSALHTERSRIRRPQFGVVLTYPSSLIKFTFLIHFPVEGAWWVNTGPLRVQTWALRTTAFMATFPSSPGPPRLIFKIWGRLWRSRGQIWEHVCYGVRASREALGRWGASIPIIIYPRLGPRLYYHSGTVGGIGGRWGDGRTGALQGDVFFVCRHPQPDGI